MGPAARAHVVHSSAHEAAGATRGAAGRVRRPRRLGEIHARHGDHGVALGAGGCGPDLFGERQGADVRGAPPAPGGRQAAAPGRAGRVGGGTGVGRRGAASRAPLLAAADVRRAAVGGRAGPGAPTALPAHHPRGRDRRGRAARARAARGQARHLGEFVSESRRPLVVEVVGPAGAGKSALIAALMQREPSIQPVLRLRQLRHLLPLVWSVVLLLPVLLEVYWESPRSLRTTLRYLARLQAFHQVVKRHVARPWKAVILDEGPVFTLAMLSGVP